MADGRDSKLEALPVEQQRPHSICANCFASARAAVPRKAAVYCWHRAAIARMSPRGWKVLEHVSDGDVRELREAGLL